MKSSRMVAAGLLLALGAAPLVAQPSTPQAFGAPIESEIGKSAKVVRASGAKPE